MIGIAICIIGRPIACSILLRWARYSCSSAIGLAFGPVSKSRYISSIDLSFIASEMARDAFSLNPGEPQYIAMRWPRRPGRAMLSAASNFRRRAGRAIARPGRRDGKWRLADGVTRDNLRWGRNAPAPGER
jgi:hypothetical protein